MYGYPVVNDIYIGYDDKIIGFEVSECQILTGPNVQKVS